MRTALISLAMLLLLGCIQQPAGNVTVYGNHSPGDLNGSRGPNATVPAQITTPPAQNSSSGLPGSNESGIAPGNESGGYGPGTGNLSNATLSNTTANITRLPVLALGNYSLVLEGTTVPSSSGPCGIFSLIAGNGSIAERFVLCPLQSRTWISPEGHKYIIFVETVSAGYDGAEGAGVRISG